LAKNTSTHATPKGTVPHSPVKTAATTGSARPGSPAPVAKSGAKSDAKPGTKPAVKPVPASRPVSASTKPAATSR
jgi:hypothetical protein